MQIDELIDEVAKRMTSVDGRPGVQTRVLTAIDDAPRERPRMWVVPAAVAGAAACAALVWFLMPTAPVAPGAETRVARNVTPGPAPRTGGIADEVAVRDIAAPVATPGVTAASSAGTRAADAARAITSVPAPATVSWEPSALADIPSLPPLAGPPPIVIESIVWSEVTIAPVDVRPLEVKALVIAPIEVTRLGGV